MQFSLKSWGPGCALLHKLRDRLCRFQFSRTLPSTTAGSNRSFESQTFPLALLKLSHVDFVRHPIVGVALCSLCRTGSIVAHPPRYAIHLKRPTELTIERNHPNGTENIVGSVNCFGIGPLHFKIDIRWNTNKAPSTLETTGDGFYITAM